MTNIFPILKWFAIVAGVALLCAMMFAFGGCIAPKNLAHVCSLRFPVATFDSVRTEYRQGKTTYDTSYVTVDCDSVIRAAMNGGTPIKPVNSARNGENLSVYVRVPCPPCPVRVDTFFREHSSQKEKTDKLEVMQQKYDAANKQAIRLQSGRNAWRIIALICMGLIAGSVVVKLWKTAKII